MEKLTAIQRAEREELIQKYQQQRHNEYDKQLEKLPDKVRNFISSSYAKNCGVNSELYSVFENGLKSGKYKKPSDFVNKELKSLFGTIVPESLKESLLYSVDECRRLSYPTGYNRRPFRSSDYSVYAEKIHDIISSYTSRLIVAKPFESIVKGEVTEGERACVQALPSYVIEEDITYCIDKGMPETIKYVKETFESGSESAITYDMLRALFSSNKAELHELAGKLLLAAKLQEGLRQAICETADCGSLAAFRHILGVITDNDLIRYSAVKRAVATWTGIVAYESGNLERISNKTLELINNCLNDEAYRKKCLASDDAMKVHVGLWSAAVYDADECVRLIENYCENGTHPQLAAAAYFLRETWSRDLRAKVAKKLLLTHTGELDIMALTSDDLFQCGTLNWNLYDPKLRFKECFESMDEANEVYDKLFELYNQIPKKELVFSECVYPWNEEKLTKSGIVCSLIFVAAVTQDSGKIDTMCQKLSEKDLTNYGTRSHEIEMMLSDTKTEIQLDALVSEVADREEYSRNTAIKLVKEQVKKLKPKQYKMLEDMLRYKSADVRENVIELLIGMGDDELFECAKRLISDKKEEKRTAGLDIIMQIGKDEKRGKLFERCLPLAELIEKPTSKEQILIDQLACGGTEKQESVYGHGFYSEADSYQPQISKEYIDECNKIFTDFFPNGAVAGKKRGKSKADFTEPLKALDKLIEENKNYEFTNEWNEQVLFGSCRYFEEKTADGELRVPLAEVWDKFYDEQIKSPALLERMRLASCKEVDMDEVYDIYGKEFKDAPTLAHQPRMLNVLTYLSEKHTDRETIGKVAFAILNHILEMLRSGQEIVVETNIKSQWKARYVKKGKIVEVEKKVFNLLDEQYIRLNTQFFEKQAKEHFADTFALEHALAEATGEFILSPYLRSINWGRSNVEDYPAPDVTSYIRAAYEGIITEGYMYKFMFELSESFADVLESLSGIAKNYHDSERKRMSRSRWSGWRSARALGNLLGEKKPQITDENRPLVEYAVGIYEKVTNLVLNSELKRGDTAAEFTDGILKIVRIYGAERFVQILAALGNDTLERSGIYYGNNLSKKKSLSHLLGVCVPNENDDAKKLGELLAKTDITQKRLVEAALYSPEWIDIIGEHLGWEGFRSACFYFMAHMNEQFDDVKKAIIAKFTPIPTAELSDGAFDIDWFKETVDIIGEKRFDMIYDAAKYISDGSKHSRARKYADAILGHYDKDEAIKQIKDKRNKDSLMAYALIPIENEDDTFSRYMMFKQFKKESTKFGAQRRASESAASDMAMRNLALNAGYSDVTRLTLRMETKLFDDIKPLTKPNTMGDVTIMLAVDEQGKASIVCEKGGKALKSVPAKYKKDELNIQMSEVKKQLTEQYRRTRQMLEQAMEDRTVFLASEIDDLKENPVVFPLISKLVFLCGKDIGLFEDMKLVSADGKAVKLKPSSELIVAHPLDLYNAGCWSEYQKALFERKLVQPFKQVFRELYVKTEDEKGAFTSLRYAGNQVQPAKTVSCLKTRRWVADTEDGLQKIYYKENIIARIYALADWFSPADIESPTLEWVDFFDRKDGKQMCIDDIPDIVFSEVMRDVDLAVSVAHAGGVDPETSHSTIEMRRTICEFTMPLFKLDNVRFEKTHAFITGKRADYSIHLGSGVVHLQGGPMINVLPVHSQHKGKLFLPFVDDDPKTSQIISEILLFAQDDKIKDPFILDQIR